MSKYADVLGITANGGPVTLSGCLEVAKTDTHVSGETISKSSLYVTHAFWGGHFESRNTCFSDMYFSVEWIDEWFYFYHRPFSRHEGPEDRPTLTYTAPDPITFKLTEDLIITFQMNLNENLGMFQRVFATKMSIRVESQRGLLFSDFMIILRKVKNFLSLAADRPVAFTSIKGYLKEDKGSSDSPRAPIDIYGKFDPYESEEQKVSVGSFLINYQEHSDNMAAMFQNWFERYEEYEPTFNLYFTVAANRFMHLEGRFLFLVHGIESLHRRSFNTPKMETGEFEKRVVVILENTPKDWRKWIEGKLEYSNEPSFRTRMEDVIEPFGELFGTKKERKRLIEHIVNTRNYLTHYDKKLEGKAVTEPAKLLALYLKIEGLVQLRLLKLLGMDAEKMVDIAMRYRPLREKLHRE